MFVCRIKIEGGYNFQVMTACFVIFLEYKAYNSILIQLSLKFVMSTDNCAGLLQEDSDLK